MITPKEAQKILSRKSPSSWDLGRLELANMLNFYKWQIDGRTKSYLPIFDTDSFREQIRLIPTPEDKKIYQGFLSIHDWFAQTIYQLKTLEQQFSRFLYIFNDIIDDAITFEKVSLVLQKVNNIAESKNDTDILNLFYPFKGEWAREQDNSFDEFNQMSILSVLPDDISYVKRKIFEAYYFFAGYNLTLDTMAKAYQLDEFHFANIDMNQKNQRINEVNANINKLRKQILTHKIELAEWEDLQQKKIQVLKTTFAPINTKEIKTPKEKIKELKEAINDKFTAFTDVHKDPRLIVCNWNDVNLE